MSYRSQTTAKHFEYRGDLAKTPLPEVLARVAHFRVPGVLEAVNEDVTTQIYVRDGSIVHARSSDIGTSLGVYLRRIGRLSQDQFRRVMRERGQTTERLGVLLVEGDLMSPDEVHEAILRQTEAIVWSLFSWWHGSIAFKLGEWDPIDLMGIRLPLVRVILDGIRQESDARQLIARIGGRDTILEPAFTVEHAVAMGLEREDYRLLNMVDGRRTLYELCAAGPRSGKDNAKFLYAMFVLGRVRRASDRDQLADSPVPIHGLRRSEGAVS
ncbi:MAG: DUF4388 domain-containing protein [Acidobacteriota bacterium]|nr:DUF4388 domain-containing protein [Acidobacteriota bacterium]MDH3524760.1 DUF4388 domain-containing protein [Acidobacteriota bacterium]